MKAFPNVATRRLRNNNTSAVTEIAATAFQSFSLLLGSSLGQPHKIGDTATPFTALFLR
jgi:hypothetical protein